MMTQEYSNVVMQEFNSSFFLGNSTEQQKMSKKFSAVGEAEMQFRDSQKASVSTKCSSRSEESTSITDSENQFQSLKKLNTKRNKAANKLINKVESIFERLTENFEKIMKKADVQDIDIPMAESLVYEQRANVEINPMILASEVLSGKAKILPEGAMSRSSKKIKKEKSSGLPTLAQAGRKMSISTYCPSRSMTASVSSPTTPTPMDIYANYHKRQNTFSSRRQVQSPILYREEMLETEQNLKREREFAEQDDNLSFFNVSSESNDSQAGEELNSLDFIFGQAQQDEPRFENRDQVCQQGSKNIELKMEPVDHSTQLQSIEEQKWISGHRNFGADFQLDVEMVGQEFSVVGENEISIGSQLDDEISAIGEQDAGLSCFDNLL